jgi:DNA repair exonuclease SbcCD ATPase subunit
MIQFKAIDVHDFGPLEQIKLPLYGRGLVLIRGENQDTSAADSNGSGKSHLFKAISWCLFGDTVEGDKHDEVIRHGAKQTIVGLSWSDGADDWSVVRQKARGAAASLKLFHAGEDVSAMTMQTTQLEINRRLGMDFHAWRNTVMYGQGDLARFADPATTDAERKVILKRILRLEVLDKALSLARSKLAAAGTELAKMRGELESIEAEKRGMSEGHDIQEIIGNLEAEAKALDAKASRAPRLNKILAQIQERLADMVEAKKEFEHIRVAIADARVRSERDQSVARVSKRDQARIQHQIDTLEAGECPTCGAPSASVHVKRKVGGLRQELAAACQEEASAHASVQAIATLVREQQALAAELAERLKDLQTWQQKAADVGAELKQIAYSELEATKKRKEIKRLQDEVKQHRARLAALNIRADKLLKLVEALEDDKFHTDFWVKGFGNSGLPSYLMDDIIPQIAAGANHYLETLADGDIRVEFDTQSKLKSGDLREKLSINWVIEGIPGVMPSGGQKKKISIAVDLALMDIVAAREHAGIDLLLLDEIFDGLDASGKSRVMDLLQELRHKRSSIFVISHDPGLAEMFESVVTIAKHEGVSTLAS